MTRKSKVKPAAVTPVKEVKPAEAVKAVKEVKPVKEDVKPVNLDGFSAETQELLKLLASLQQKMNLTQYDQSYVEQLRTNHQELVKTHRFRAGQLVVWKKGLKNKKLPEPNQPAIIVEVFDEPRFETSRDPGSPYYAEPLDLVLGIMTKEGEFLTFYFDKRRFEPYKE
jgi:hypothetical protein